ncbi:MAG: ankyrin repeat domain-containing protein, partial [Geminicoccaceae bacterium]
SRIRVALIVAILVAAASRADAGPLHDAAAEGDLGAVETLLRAGNDADATGANQETPLMAAALADQPGIAVVLVAAGADVMARNQGGLTPLHAAAYGGSVEVAALLLDKGAVLEDRENVSGATPFMLAAEQGQLAVAELLIERGADIGLPDREGFTPLSQAWAKQRTDMVRLLKAHGAVCQSAEMLGSEDFHRRCVAAGT